MGETTVPTNGSGAAGFSVALAAAVPGSYLITATATNAAGSTSAFSNAVTVIGALSTAKDGIPDAWKARYGFSLTDPTLAGTDSDGTGMTNLQKYKAGLNPNNPLSFLRITAVDRIGADLGLTFPSVTGIIYRVESRLNLTGNSAWTVLADEIVGTGSPIQITDPQATLQSQDFLRIRVLP